MVQQVGEDRQRGGDVVVVEVLGSGHHTLALEPLTPLPSILLGSVAWVLVRAMRGGVDVAHGAVVASGVGAPAQPRASTNRSRCRANQSRRRS